MTTAQFQTFLNNMQKLVAVQGGDLNLAIEIGSDPTKYDEFVKWTKTVDTRSDLMNFQTVELWTLMKQAIDPELKTWANTIHDAYNWIVEHPQVYSTAALLYIESDWGEFGLLSPSAVIIPDPKVPFPDPTNTFLNSTKVTWGKEHSHVEYRMSIKFVDTLFSPWGFFSTNCSNNLVFWLLTTALLSIFTSRMVQMAVHRAKA